MVALIKQSSGIAYPIDGCGIDLLVYGSNALGKLIDTVSALTDGNVHLALQRLNGCRCIAKHVAKVISIRKQIFTRGCIARTLRKLLPCREKSIHGRAYARPIGFVEKTFQRTHDIFLLSPAGRVGRLTHVGAFKKRVEVPQHLLRVDPKPFPARLGGDGACITLVNIAPGVAFGIGIGDIAASDRNPGLSGIKGCSAHIHETAEHGYSLPEISAA